MLGISAVYRQMHAGDRFSLAYGLAHVRSVGALESAADYADKLLADLRRKNVALLGAWPGLTNSLRQSVAPVRDFLLVFRGALVRQRFAQFEILVDSLGEVAKSRVFRGSRYFLRCARGCD